MEKCVFLKEWSNVEDYLMRFALKLTKNETVAENLFQDTVLKAFSNSDW